jgi:hypothetical protein
MERHTQRTVASVLVFVLVLAAIWAGYNLLSATRAPSGTTTQTLADYGLSGTGNFSAALLPNDLCNCSEVSGGNATLFPAITRTINVTLATTTSISAPATVGTIDVFTVVLSTAAWSKPILTQVNDSTSSGATSVSRQDLYSINVSAVQALVAQIDGQLNYDASQASLTVTSTVISTIALGGVSDSPGSVTTANFTFFSSTIGAGFTDDSVTGSVTATSAVSDPVPLLAYIYPIAALAAVVASVAWLLALRPRADEGERIPPLDDLIAPFEEAIAKTASALDPKSTIAVDHWEDLVKISDTLGKPILRPPASTVDAPRATFYVLDGSVGYCYRYAPFGSPPSVPAGAARTVTTTDRLQTVATRIRALGPSDPRFEEALEQFRQVREFLRSRQWLDADRAFDQLEQMLNAPTSSGRARR